MSADPAALSPVREVPDLRTTRQGAPDGVRGDKEKCSPGMNLGQVNGVDPTLKTSRESRMEEPQQTRDNHHNMLDGPGPSLFDAQGQWEEINGARPTQSEISASRSPIVTSNVIPRLTSSTLPSPISSNSTVSPSATDSGLAMRHFSVETHSRPRQIRGASDYPISPISPVKEFVNGGIDTDRRRNRNLTIDTSGHSNLDTTGPRSRPGQLHRALSTPAPSRVTPIPRKAEKERTGSTSVETEKPTLDKAKLRPALNTSRPLPSPMPSSFPLPPVSIATYLQLELSSQRPSHQ